MDDIVITSPSIDAIQSLKEFLHGHLKLKDLGDLKYFLGLKLARFSKGLVIFERIILFNYLRTLGFLPVSLLMFHGSKLKLTTHDDELLQDASQCRSLIGRLLYFTLSRPNITFAIHKLSQFLSEPRIPHLEAVRYLLLYLKFKPGQCLFFSSSSSLQLKASSNAD